MYPRNNASPEPVAIGAVVQISDGAVQTSGVTVRIKPIGVAEGDGAGTTAYSTDGIVEYTPTQSETNYTSFILIAKKTGCIPAAVTVVTSASDTTGYSGVDWGKVANKTTTNALTGTTIADTQKVDLNTIKTQAITCSAGVTVSPFVGSTGAAINGTNANTLSSHDPGATLGTSTLTQTQVTGGAYALNSASFAFNSALDLTSTQKASVNAEADTALADAKAGYVTAIWAALTSALSTVGSIGKLLVDNINATISSRSTYDGSDTSGTTTLLARLTASRAGYLDNLNVGGAVASQADITALNQSASRRIILTTVGQYERPESGSTTYTVEARTYDGDGAATNADSTPTLTATGSVTGSLAANLSAASNPATGVYRWTYTVEDDATQEQIRFDVSATMSTAFTLSVYTQVVDLVSATWTTADRTKLTAVYDDWADGGRLDLILDARASQTSVNTAQADLDVLTGVDGVILAANQPNYVPATSSQAVAITTLLTSTGVVVASHTTAAKAEIEQEALDALQQTVPDSVPADGSRPNVQQAVRMILQALTEGGISGTSWVIKKEDGSTTLFTVTLDDDTAPTSKTRSG